MVADASGYPLSRKKKKGMVRVPPIADAFAAWGHRYYRERKKNEQVPRHVSSDTLVTNAVDARHS